MRRCYPEQGDELWVGGLRLLLHLTEHPIGRREKDR